jgi:hypothetical protein
MSVDYKKGEPSRCQGLARGRRIRKGVRGCSCGDRRLTLKYNDSICEIRCHYKVVFDDKSGLFRVEDEPASLRRQVSMNVTANQKQTV